ncbi:L-seryl-tRNA(Sec) kinase [Octopus sinensis]|uniref:L-seryl-tRNA(Sec) kinase n=1 Tax=Octopus sinensis TaxID=2607531 RepID=A0A6P7TV96_9MOLL|nr:L-seryl-tRNA(Sec) kinase [Octopus sinensis]XP_029656276.1 L-seryl-tRNA(Sec) kinase [Octopus sinensis]XP_036355123.1 L-seryl-tRNA(Sec) kinase [Octopus sinensis]
MDTCLLILCGLPACGKTTLAKRLKASPEFKSIYHVVHLSYDDLMPDNITAFLTEKPNLVQQGAANWKKYREDIVLCVENILKTFPNGKAEIPVNVCPDLWAKINNSFMQDMKKEEFHLLVIIDDNMYYQGMRYPFYQLARKYSIGFCQVYLECNIELALKRNNHRPNPIPEEVIHTMASKFEPPSPSERNWEVHSLYIKDQTICCLDDVLALVDNARQNKAAPLSDNVELRQISRVKCSISTLHQADQILRKLVSGKMSDLDVGLSCKNKKEMSCVYLQIRTRLYSELKLGSLLIPESIENVTDASKNTESNLYQWLKDIFESNCNDSTVNTTEIT